MNRPDPLPDGFKMTELGPLPEEWRVVRLGEVSLVKQGRTPKREEYDDRKGTRIIKVKDFSDGGLVRITPMGDRSFVVVDIGSSPRVKANDVLILNSGHSSDVVGQKVGVVPQELEGALYVAELTVIRSLEGLSDPYFLFACLMTPNLRDTIRTFVKGGHLYTGQIRSLPIPLPPLPEQRAIAQVLRTVQEAKEATERVIQAARELKKSLMQHLFTYGPVPLEEADRVPLQETEIGPIPQHWQVVRLGEVATIDWGNTSLTKRLYKPFGFPAYSAAGQDGFLDFYEYDGEAVIVSAIGARCGKCFYARGKWTAIKNTIVILPNESLVNVKFIHYYLDDEHKWPKSGSGQPFISIGKAKSLPILLPPLPEQQEIARILQAVDEKIKAEEERKEALEALFKSLLHHLMTGKVRVAWELGEVKV